MSEMIKFNGKIYDGRNGSPFDRGAADSYYDRSFRPHYFTGGTYLSQEILVEQGTPAYDDYVAGWEWNVKCGATKDYA